MALRIATYNLEWFDDAFSADNTLRADAAIRDRAAAIADVIGMVDPDILVAIEAPGTTFSTGKSTVTCIRNFAAEFGLRQSDAMIGFPSAGRQEIAAMFDPAMVSLAHDPGGDTGSSRNPPFNEPFHYDSDRDRVLEIYEHYRPPLEAHVTRHDGGADFWLLGVHAKSKGIFSKNDLLHYQREEERNRRKLFAETSHIRMRIDEWQALGRRVAVLGDINDGPGMDAAEFRFGRSAVELVMGTVFEPEGILKSWAGEPEWGEFGFTPSSARFTDRFTEDPINVLIDHVLVSQTIPVASASDHRIWNPFQLDQAEPFKSILMKASDHFPVSLDIG